MFDLSFKNFSISKTFLKKIRFLIFLFLIDFYLFEVNGISLAA